MVPHTSRKPRIGISMIFWPDQRPGSEITSGIDRKDARHRRPVAIIHRAGEIDARVRALCLVRREASGVGLLVACHALSTCLPHSGVGAAVDAISVLVMNAPSSEATMAITDATQHWRRRGSHSRHRSSGVCLAHKPRSYLGHFGPTCCWPKW